MFEYSVIITAGGTGKRMGGQLPKQFIELGQKPILIHTLERFYNFNPHIQLVLTLPDTWRNYWSELVQKNQCLIPHTVVSGGEERFHSIKNALSVCHGSYIMIHDGVRPFVSEATLERCFSEVKLKGQVIPVLPMKESIRELDPKGLSKSVIRDHFYVVQTPQCFKREVLLKAYENDFCSEFTDDATLVEKSGFPIYLVDGNEENIKITTILDLKLAMLLLPD